MKVHATITDASQSLCVIQISGVPAPCRGGRGLSRVKCPHPRISRKNFPGVKSDKPWVPGSRIITKNRKYDTF